MAGTHCVDGFAGPYPCRNVDLLAFLPLSAIGCGSGNDIWGWTDPSNGKGYAIMGCDNGTSFVDISDPENPIYLGRLPTRTFGSFWRGVKVYADHAFVISEARGHGMQIFDLTRLRNVTSPPVTFTATGHYDGFDHAHSVAVNEATGYAYVVGSNTCAGGLHMVNIQNPASPTAAGCFSADGYTHDTQCIIYQGPDTAHRGKEICFNSNEDTLTIVDVTDKAAPVQLSRTGYAGSAYAHQGWLTEDHRYFLMDDERDELDFGHNTRTYIWDLSRLNAPVLLGAYTAATRATDHNLYIRGRFAYEANYHSGLRILDLRDIANANLSEAAFFDIYPADDETGFGGAWGNYPFFNSGVVIVSGIEQGLFVLDPVLPTGPAPSAFYTVEPCRVADTRDLAGPFGAPPLSANTSRTFLLAGRCGIPATAKAVSLNLTVTEPTAQGNLRLYPAGTLAPLASVLNYRAGQTRANNAIIALGAAGNIAVRCDQASGSVQVILDVNGYFQ